MQHTIPSQEPDEITPEPDFAISTCRSPLPDAPEIDLSEIKIGEIVDVTYWMGRYTRLLQILARVPRGDTLACPLCHERICLVRISPNSQSAFYPVTEHCSGSIVLANLISPHECPR